MLPRRLKMIKNEFLGNLSFNHKKLHLRNKPIIHDIELTNHCNLNCIMCVRDLMTRKKGFMDFNLFKKIIDENYKDMNFIYLQNHGEPLFHKDIDKFIAYLKRKKIKVGLHTNGLLLTKKITERLIKSGLDSIRFSFDGVTKEVYEKIRKGSNYKKVMNNLKNLIEIKKKKLDADIKIEMQIIRMKETEDSINKFKHFWKDKVDRIIIKDMIDWRGNINYKRIVPCLYAWKSVVILWNGDVVPCCNDWNGSFVLGNIRRDTLRNIWNNKKYKILREKLLKKRIDFFPCKNCSVMDHIKPKKNYPFNIHFFKQLKKII